MFGTLDKRKMKEAKIERRQERKQINGKQSSEKDVYKEYNIIYGWKENLYIKYKS